MVKKAALLVNGQYDVLLRRDGLKESLQAIKEHFYDYDIFYQCWDTHLNRHIFKDIDEEIFWIPMPEEEEKNPYDLVLENGIIIPGYHAERARFASKQKQKKLKTRCFQQYSFCLLYKHVTEKYNYDYIFRTRWDVVFSKYFSADYLLHLAKTNVVGCGVSTSTKIFKAYYGSNVRKEMTPQEMQRKKRTVIRDLINSEIGIISETKNKTFDENHHTNYLSDFMMAIHKDDFDVDNSIKLFHEDIMYPSEWGWWQLFCQKRKHINVNGLTSIRRNVEQLGYKKHWKY